MAWFRRRRGRHEIGATPVPPARTAAPGVLQPATAFRAATRPTPAANAPADAPMPEAPAIKKSSVPETRTLSRLRASAATAPSRPCSA